VGIRHADPRAAILDPGGLLVGGDGENKTRRVLWLYWFGPEQRTTTHVGCPFAVVFSAQPEAHYPPSSRRVPRPPWRLLVHSFRRPCGRWGGDRDKGSNCNSSFRSFSAKSLDDHGKTRLYLSPLGGYRRGRTTRDSHGLTWLGAAYPALGHDRQGRSIRTSCSTALSRHSPRRHHHPHRALLPTDRSRRKHVFAVLPLFWYFARSGDRDATRTRPCSRSTPPHSPDERLTAAGILASLLGL